MRSLALCLVLLTTTAHAEPWVFKYDELPDSLSAAAAQIDGGQVYTQPGFVRGEAFGQIYRPTPEMFPLQIIGFDLILAGAPFISGEALANATIEVYNSDSKTPDPGTEPLFVISTGELFNPVTQDFGRPLQGNTGLSIEFDMTEEDSRPPLITSGNIWLMVRFQDDAQSLSSEWGALECFQVEGFFCGCQTVGTVHDTSITPDTNVIHHMAPLGACTGPAMGWTYMEDVPASSSGFRIDGDVVLRLRADVAAGACEPECVGRTCGDDGCGGTCGTCGDRFCVDGACVACQPDCLSKQCGDNGCGGSCGTCGEDQTCGTDFFCHDPCVPNCANRQCGDDGCGDVCGTCDAGESCTAGRCEAAACVPDCDGVDCGPDGCGGDCGTCAANEQCEAGICKADAPVEDPFEVRGVSPAQGLSMIPTAVSITGQGFKAGARVKMGAADCTDVEVVGDALISAVVPALPYGVYDVIVINPDDAVATKSGVFQVYPVDIADPEAGTEDSGCTGGATSLFALAALAFARRRQSPT